MRTGLGTALLAVGMLAAPAAAKDAEPCPAGLICASNPQTIVAALQAAGYKARLTKDNGGDPDIETASSGYNWDVYFYDCENHSACASVQFEVAFKADPHFTASLANTWNQKHRFLRAFVRDSGSMVFDFDMSTIGGINAKNFADQLDWMDTSTAAAGKFVSDATSAK